MKISYLQLQKHLSTPATPETLKEILTEIGLEVGKLEPLEGSEAKLKGVIIGQIVSCLPHPNADRLKLTKVDVGQKEPLSIICGAPNVAQNQKVAVARVGTYLDINGQKIRIKPAKIRGIVSNGMLCSEKELGIGDGDQGILVLDAQYQVGKPLSQYIDIPQNFIFEIDITPNRSDAISHWGVARDLYAALRSRGIAAQKIVPPSPSFSEEKIASTPIQVTIHDIEKCPRYCGVVISNVTIKPSPKWLQNFLISLGQKPINNLVDITNYIMQDLGQPLHAFDYEEIVGKKINIRQAQEGESIKTLDQKEVTLKNSDLVIADAQHPLCLAGVMGGKSSGVSEKTKTIFLESAYFTATGIRKTSKRTQIKTESCYRYERGIDPDKTMEFLHRAVDMILSLAGGEITSKFIDIYPNPIPKREVKFSHKALDTLFGEVFPREKLDQILCDLNIEILKKTQDMLTLHVPPFRTDVTREIDVIEEIFRIYGYDNIPMPKDFRFSISPQKTQNSKVDEIRNLLSSLGYNEVLTHSFRPSKVPKVSDGMSEKKRVFVENALQGNCSMRDHMIYSLLEVAGNHSRKGKKNIKIFEFGKTYHKESEGNYYEKSKLSLLISGQDISKTWNSSPKPLTFFDMKGVVALILKKAGLENALLSKDVTALEKYEIFQGGIFHKNLGIKIGILKADFLEYYDLSTPSLYVEIDWQTLDDAIKKQRITYRETSKYPSVQRDLALIIDRNTSFYSLQKTAFKAVPVYLKKIILFDVYEGKAVDSTKKSYGISFTLSKKEGTFTEFEINTIMQKLIQDFAKEHNATLRS